MMVKKNWNSLWKNKYIIILLFTMIIVIPSGLIFYYTKNLKGYTYTDHWGNYISLLGVMIGMIGSVIIFIKNKKDEEEKNKNILLVKNLDQVNNEKFDSLIPLCFKLEEDTITKLSSEELTKFLSIINRINELTKLTDQLEDKYDFTDPFLDSPIIMNIISSPAFQYHAKFIQRNFPDIYEQLNELSSKFDDSKPSEKILGEWIISKPNAYKAKILIGISGYDNTVKQVIKLPMYNERTNSVITNNNNNRKSFKGENNSLCIITNPKVKILENWTSRNPVLYPNHFNDYKEDIKKFIEGNVPSLDMKKLEGNQDIIVVKTFFL